MKDGRRVGVHFAGMMRRADSDSTRLAAAIGLRISCTSANSAATETGRGPRWSRPAWMKETLSKSSAGDASADRHAGSRRSREPVPSRSMATALRFGGTDVGFAEWDAEERLERIRILSDRVHTARGIRVASRVGELRQRLGSLSAGYDGGRLWMEWARASIELLDTARHSRFVAVSGTRVRETRDRSGFGEGPLSAFRPVRLTPARC